MQQIGVTRQIYSVARELQSVVIKLCPLLQKSLILFFFGLLFGLSNYIIMLISSAQIQEGYKIALLLFGVWCLLNIIFNYIMAIVVKPGNPNDIPMHLLNKIKKRCNKCDSIKPPRTHHCSICNRCIIQMDHHCPWIGNCVGHHNRQYFVNFLTYLTFGLTIGIVLINTKSKYFIIYVIKPYLY